MNYYTIATLLTVSLLLMIIPSISAQSVPTSATILIFSPTNNSSFNSNSLILFAGAANDSEGNDISDELIWVILDEQIGSGGSFSIFLSDGEYVITAKITDSEGQTTSESISLTVLSATEPEETESEETESEETVPAIANLGQTVSNFVNESRSLFVQQGIETKEAIKECRDAKRNAESSKYDVEEQCKLDLKAIRDSYKELRQVYRDTFKEFRDYMKILIIEVKGLEIDESKKAAAFVNMESSSKNKDKRENIMELLQKMNEETSNEKKQLQKQLKEERDTAREMMKNEREEAKELKKQIKESKDEVESDDIEATKEALEQEPVAKKEQKTTEPTCGAGTELVNDICQVIKTTPAAEQETTPAAEQETTPAAEQETTEPAEQETTEPAEQETTEP
ncbi:MAG: hypothetical protein ISR80_06150, partial [Nitrosopumilus sp.]|nr:hypothetical protein [Nitrosopumilus sp.]